MTDIQRKVLNQKIRNYIVLGIVTIILLMFLFPLVMVFINSFKTEQEFYQNGAFSLPVSFSLNTIIETWKAVAFGNKLVNSLIISVITALFATILSVLNSYTLGIGRIKAKLFFLVFFAIAMMIPQEALIYPLYTIFKMLGIYNTRFSVILFTVVIHSSYGTYLLSSIFETTPRELVESSHMDGCGKIGLLLKIIIPVQMPAITVLFVFFFMWTWNDFFVPLIFLVSAAKQTVPLSLALLEGERTSIITMQCASALLGILPCIIFFFIFQRSFTRGITAGAVKG